MLCKYYTESVEVWLDACVRYGVKHLNKIVKSEPHYIICGCRLPKLQYNLRR